MLEDLSDEDKESTLLGQVWDPQNGLSDSYYEITTLSIVYEMVEYTKDGATARSQPPTVILVHNPKVNPAEMAANGVPANEQAPGIGR